MKKILVNDNPWQTRIAITRDGSLNNIYFASHATEPLERSFFKGIVSKILPGIQTAFVDIGQEKAGFLHISEIDHELAIQRMIGSTQLEEIGKKTRSRRSTPKKDISHILKEGEEVLVQVSKEPIYEKGAKLSTCFTLPGRFIVLMPNIPRIGISKKIEDRDERARLKALLLENLPEGMGAIIRTTSEKRDGRAILQDLSYLVDTWTTIQKRFKEAKPMEKIYEDIPLTHQVIRDHLDDDVEAVIVDNKKEQSSIHQFVKSIAKEFSHRVKLYTGKQSLFEKFDINRQIEEALHKKVSLKSGGSLVIESTEAMTVIDVNTGKFTGSKNLEETILKTNLEAAEEIVRQLKLRNIGGLIVIDFIDMMAAANRQKLSRFLDAELKEHDKFQSVVLKVSEFGLVQMTRKRSGKTLVQQLTDDCSTCGGSGFVKSTQTQSFTLLRKIREEFKTMPKAADVTLSVSPDVFEYITSTEYDSILELEKTFKCTITLNATKRLEVDRYKLEGE